MEDPAESGNDHGEPVLPKVAAGIVAAAAGIRLGPGAALALGAAGPLYEALAVKSWQEFWPGAQQRAAQMLETAADDVGCDAGELADRIASSEQSQLQTAIAMSAAERTTWPPQVKALGKVLAAGLMAEGDAVDLPQFALGAMAELGRLHVSLLELLVRYEPDWTGDGVGATLHRAPSYQNVYMGGDRPDNPKIWSIGFRKWTANQIYAARPQLRPVLTTLLGTVQRHGLAAQNDTAPDVLKQLGPITLQQATIRNVEPSWSPTELGETVLGYYVEASAESPILDGA